MSAICYIKKRKDFRIEHWCDNQFTIFANFVYAKGNNLSDVKEVTEEGNYEHLYYPSLVTLRVDLFTFLNKTFGTDFEVTDEMREYANSFRGKREDLCNTGVEEGWRFTKYGGFYHRYRFDTESGKSLGICESTYGYDWKKDDLIAFAKAVEEFFETDPLSIAKAAMQKRYDMYNRIGIGHIEDPLYSDNATGEFIPPKGCDVKISQTMLK